MKVLEFSPQNNLNVNHRKENYFQCEYSIVVFDEKTKKFSTPVVLRIYITPSINYACVWGIEKHFEGSFKGSAFQSTNSTALNALIIAGFVFEDAWSSSIEDVMSAIAECFGYKNYFIHKANP
jgi:hypothetical protein